MRSYKYIDIITALFAVILILSNITSTKLSTIGSFTFDAGLVLFPLAYIFGDILTEVYGYARARRVIWIGFAANALMLLTFYIMGLLPPAADWPLQDAYMSILGPVGRIVIASLTAYLVGEFANSYVLAKMKVKTKGAGFGKRAISSTMVGQALDTTIFLLVAFAGIIPGPILWVMWYTNYLVKVLVEVLLLPITTAVVRHIKTVEALDVFDTKTNFSPFAKEVNTTSK